jgi:hypothetical protein
MNYLKTPVVCIFEAKKCDIDDSGRAQLYKQLKTCYEIATKDFRTLIKDSYENLDGDLVRDCVERQYSELITKFPMYIFGIVSTMNE